MNIKNFLAMMVAASVMVMGTTSCDKDDDDPAEQNVSAATAMVGTYNGEFVLSVMGSGDTTQVDMTINKVDDATIQLVTPAAGSGAMALPSLSVELPAVGKDRSYSASAESVSGSVTVNGAEKAYTFSNVAVIVNGDEAAIAYSLQYGKMPMAMVVSFKGKKAE